jgi:hypothetical protein
MAGDTIARAVLTARTGVNPVPTQDKDIQIQGHQPVVFCFFKK